MINAKQDPRAPQGDARKPGTWMAWWADASRGPIAIMPGRQ
jgi:hypothetical protein